MSPDTSSPTPLNGTGTINARAAAFPLTRTQLVALALAALVAVAATFRLSSPAVYGLADDEVSKFRAAESYSHGDFAVNAEHPMLMKLAVWASIGAADRWNALASARYQIPVEAAVRLPNAVVGAASVLVTYGIADAYFGTPTALVAALLLALDPNVTSINRHAKEDTFVVFFFLLAVWLYERGKQVGVRDTVAAQQWYLGSAASFGLMMASKYLPHLYGLYALANVATLRDAGRNSPIKRRFFATMGMAFAIANFAIFFPATWAHMLEYVRAAGLPHHGGPYGERLWVTDVPVSPLGMPPTFYVMFLLTHVPLVTLAGAVVGGCVAWARRRERGFVFLRILFVIQMVGYSLVAAKFLRYSLPMLVIFDLMAAVGLVFAINWLTARIKADARTVFMPVAYVALAIVLFAGQVHASPFYAMHRTAVGRLLDADGQLFPEASYDYGVREAVSHIVTRAAPGAAIVSDVPQVVRFYLDRSSRADLRVESFSASGLSNQAAEQWVIVQDAHVYFETQELIAMLRMRHQPVAEYRINGVSILQLFRITPDHL